jgi:hypothetical protein
MELNSSEESLILGYVCEWGHAVAQLVEALR